MFQIDGDYFVLREIVYSVLWTNFIYLTSGFAMMKTWSFSLVNLQTTLTWEQLVASIFVFHALALLIQVKKCLGVECLELQSTVWQCCWLIAPFLRRWFWHHQNIARGSLKSLFLMLAANLVTKELESSFSIYDIHKLEENINVLMLNFGLYLK